MEGEDGEMITWTRRGDGGNDRRLIVVYRSVVSSITVATLTTKTSRNSLPP